jgi:hypothetical protein
MGHIEPALAQLTAVSSLDTTNSKGLAILAMFAIVALLRENIIMGPTAPASEQSDAPMCSASLLFSMHARQPQFWGAGAARQTIPLRVSSSFHRRVLTLPLKSLMSCEAVP